jgi:hypothetical protein
MAAGIVVVGLVWLFGGGIGTYLMRPAPKPAVVLAKPEPSAPPPVVREAPKAEPPVLARAPVKRGPAPKVEAPPAPPVDASPTVATLHIDSDVPGAQVFIDRAFVGGTPVIAKDVKPGSHRLNVSAPGYDAFADTIDVVAGPRDLMIRLKDVKLDAKIDVVHKHAFGSCKGTLVATPQGLRYETTSKNDGFSAALADIESFDVDYLEKNLKVKLKNGKQYDFTDAEGNADRLYLFHGEVDKVRQRLKKGGGP